MNLAPSLFLAYVVYFIMYATLCNYNYLEGIKHVYSLRFIFICFSQRQAE